MNKVFITITDNANRESGIALNEIAHYTGEGTRKMGDKSVPGGTKITMKDGSVHYDSRTVADFREYLIKTGQTFSNSVIVA